MAAASISSSPPFFFSATRWVLMEDKTLPITWDNIVDYEGITTRKVVRIVLLILPALVFDLVHKVWTAWFRTRDVKPVALPFIPAESIAENNWLAPVDDKLKKSHTDLLVNSFGGGKVGEQMAACVLAYLPQKAHLQYSSTEYPVSSIFSLTPLMEIMVSASQTDRISLDTLKRVQKIPNYERTLYSQIKNFDFSGRKSTLSQDQELVEKLPNLKSLRISIHESGCDELLVGTIERLKNSLEEFVAHQCPPNLELPGNAVIDALAECSKLTCLSLTVSPLDGAQEPGTESMIELAQKGRLESLKLEGMTIHRSVYQAFFDHCPLKHVDIGFWNLINFPAQWVFGALVASPRPHLLSLKYSMKNTIYRIYRLEIVTDEQLRLLAKNCPNLKSLDVPLGLDQESLLEELLPQWKNLEKLKFSDFFSENQIARMVKSSPSLREINLGSFDDDDLTRWKSFKLLGQLHRSLRIEFCFLGSNKTNINRMYRQMKDFPWIQIVNHSEDPNFR